jgi:hypothetical protein
MKPQRFQLNKGGPERPVVTERAARFITELSTEKSWLIEVRQYHPKRTLKQNATLFGPAYDVIMEATGLEGEKDRARLHANLCCDYFGYKDVPMVGRMPRRTTTTNERGESDTLNTVEMAKFYNFIRRTATEYGIYIPEPDPLYKMPKRYD